MSVPSARAWARERGTLWELGLRDAPVPRVAAATPVRWDEPGPGSSGELASAMGLSDPRTAVRRMERGARVFAGLVDGRIACYGWVSVGAECIGELERRIRLAPDEAYVWDCLTLPDHRRLGLYTSLLAHIARSLRAEGFVRLWIGSAVANRPSIRGFRAAGFRPVLGVVYVRVGTLSCLGARRMPSAPRALAASARDALARDDERPWGPLLVGRVRSPGLPWCAGAGS